MDKDIRPRCPQCGEPAKTAILIKARVDYELMPDGTLGKIVQSHGTRLYIDTYRCGGGHTFSVKEALTQK